MRLAPSRLALAELDEILGFIRERSPLGARNVEARMRRAFQHIADHPEGAERVKQRAAVRRLPLARYRPSGACAPRFGEGRIDDHLDIGFLCKLAALIDECDRQPLTG